MDYEKKYKNVLERAKDYFKANQKIGGSEENDMLSDIFPELSESEDERIRKAIVKHFELYHKRENVVRFHGVDYEDILVWLGKQKTIDVLNKEEREFADNVDSYRKDMDEFYEKGYNAGREAEKQYWLKKQGEQKSTLPIWKYKKDHTPLLRDSIILNKYGGVAKSPSGAIVSDVWVIDYDELAKLPKEELEKQGEQELPIEKLPEEMKTIGESLGFTTQEECDEYNQIVSDLIMSDNKIKPKFNIGDWVVHDMSDGRKAIRQIVNMTNKSYVLDGKNFNTFYFNDLENDYHLWTIDDAKDGDILMGNAPFIFNGNLEGGIGCPGAHCAINTLGKFQIPKYPKHWTSHTTTPATKEQRDLLFQKMKEAGYEWDAEKKELKLLITNGGDFESENCEQKSAWSEEDEKMLDDAIGAVYAADYYTYDDKEEIEHWLKSLKNRYTWKPSDEQMQCLLSEVTAWTKGCPKQIVLESLYNDLKKLTE